jgi:multiple sugar transport system permease protein
MPARDRVATAPAARLPPAPSPPGTWRASRAGAVRRRILPYALLAPAAVLLVGLFGAPFVALFYYSLRDYSLSGASHYVGLANFSALLRESRTQHDLVITFVYLAGVLVLSVPIAYVAAILIARAVRGITAVRSILMIPWVLAPVVTALLFRTLIDPVRGPLAKAASWIAGRPVYLASNGSDAMVVVILHAAWRSFPLETLLLAAAISGIPHELYEAVRIDGGSRWAAFYHITLPLTRTALISACIMVSVFTMQDVEGLYSLTQGGPGYGTESAAVRLFKEAFLYYNVSGGAAIGLIMVGITAVVLVALFMLSRRIEERS